MVHNSVPNFRSQRGTPGMEAHQIVPYLLIFSSCEVRYFIRQKKRMHSNTLKRKVKEHFPILDRVYIKQLQFFRIPSNDKFNFDTCF